MPKSAQRLAWLTGFRGSAGMAIVLADKAAIFVDGRYTLAVRAQVDTIAFVPHQIPEQSPEAWIFENLPKGGRLGFDPWLATMDGHERFARACERAGGSFVAVERNPVDIAWRDRPAAPLAPMLPHPVEFAGETSEARRSRIAAVRSRSSRRASASALCTSIPPASGRAFATRQTRSPNTARLLLPGALPGQR